MAVIEKAEIVTVEGRADEFASVLAKAMPVIRGAEGCIRATATRGIEHPGTFLLLIEWTSVEAHQSCKSTPEFGEFVGLIKDFFAAPPGAVHYAPLDV